MAKRKKGKDKFDALGERLQPMLDAISSKIPPNVNIDIVKGAEMLASGLLGYYGTKPLVEMLASGLLGYYGTKPLVKFNMGVAAFLFDIMPEDKKDVNIWEWLLGGPVAGYLGIFSGMGITEEEQAKIDAWEPTDEEKMLMGLACAILLPKTPEIIKGFGEIVKGVGEIIPL